MLKLESVDNIRPHRHEVLLGKSRINTQIYSFNFKSPRCHPNYLHKFQIVNFKLDKVTNF